MVVRRYFSAGSKKFSPTGLRLFEKDVRSFVWNSEDENLTLMIT